MSGAGLSSLTCTAWNAQQDQAGASAIFHEMAARWQPANGRNSDLLNWPISSSGLCTHTRGAVEFQNLGKVGLDQRPRSHQETFHQELFHCVHQVKRGTVWKLHDFSIIQIYREIKLGESRIAKSAILTHLEALNFDFYEF